MFKLFKNKNEVELNAFVEGITRDIKLVDDIMFSQELIGRGIAIKPSSNKIVAPADGTILMVFPTNHALGIQLENGIELLIHIGIDTVKLKGEGFKAFVQEGQHVRKGELLVEVNFDYVKQNGYQEDVLMVVTTPKETYSIEYPVYEKSVGQKDKVLTVTKL